MDSSCLMATQWSSPVWEIVSPQFKIVAMGDSFIKKWQLIWFITTRFATPDTKTSTAPLVQIPQLKTLPQLG